MEVAQEVDWGRVGVGIAAARTLELRSGDDTNCIVELQVEGAGFSSESARTVVPANGTVEVPLVFLPTAAGTAEGRLHIRADDVRTVRLAGEGVQRCLSVDPPAIDFGEAQARCAPATRSLHLVNSCDHEISLSIPPDYMTLDVVIDFSLPDRIAPAATEVATLSFRPYEPGPFAARLGIRDGTAVESEVQLRGVGTPPIRRVVDSYDQGVRPIIDYLFVIDDSAATAAKLEPLADALAWARNVQIAEGIHARWAVTTTSRTPTPGCAGTGNGGLLVPFDELGTRWIDLDETVSLDALLAPFRDLPACGQAPNEALAAALAAATEMHRPNAVLAVVVVSARDDRSSTTPEELRDRFQLHHDQLRIYAIAGPTGGCEGAEEASRLYEITHATGCAVANICDSTSWDSIFALGYPRAPILHSFTLLAAPLDLDADGGIADEIEVRVDGVPIEPVSGDATIWRYSEETHSIDFDPLHRPPEGSRVAIEYPAEGCAEG